MRQGVRTVRKLEFATTSFGLRTSTRTRFSVKIMIILNGGRDCDCDYGSSNPTKIIVKILRLNLLATDAWRGRRGGDEGVKKCWNTLKMSRRSEAVGEGIQTCLLLS